VRAAVEGRAASDLKLLAVTVLTSFGRADLDEMGYNCESPTWWSGARAKPWRPAWMASCLAAGSRGPSKDRGAQGDSGDAGRPLGRARAGAIRSGWRRRPRPFGMVPTTW